MNLLDKLPEEILDYIWFLSHEKTNVNKDIQILALLWNDMKLTESANFIDFVTIFRINNDLVNGENINVKKILIPSPHVKLGNYWKKIDDIKSQLIIDFEEFYPEYISCRLPISLNDFENKCKLICLLK